MLSEILSKSIAIEKQCKIWVNNTDINADENIVRKIKSKNVNERSGVILKFFTNFNIEVFMKNIRKKSWLAASKF